jgi:hypothetical protein
MHTKLEKSVTGSNEQGADGLGAAHLYTAWLCSKRKCSARKELPRSKARELRRAP